MVVFVHDGKYVAAGHAYRDRSTLHGHNIPAEHVCVLLTASQDGIPSPLVLGDPSENTLLKKGNFFALPTKSLLSAKRMCNGTIQLNSFK